MSSYRIIFSDSTPPIVHSAKGTTWEKKNHKYIKKEGKKYYYKDGKKYSSIGEDNRTTGDKLRDKPFKIEYENVPTKYVDAITDYYNKNGIPMDGSNEKVTSKDIASIKIIPSGKKSLSSGRPDYDIITTLKDKRTLSAHATADFLDLMIEDERKLYK